MGKCPICGAPAEVRPKNPHGPFCSERCRQVDLGKWLSGEYFVAVQDGDEEGNGDKLPLHDDYEDIEQ